MDQSVATVSTVGCNDDPSHGEADVHSFPAALTYKSSSPPVQRQKDVSSHASGRSNGPSSAELRPAHIDDTGATATASSVNEGYLDILRRVNSTSRRA